MGDSVHSCLDPHSTSRITDTTVKRNYHAIKAHIRCTQDTQTKDSHVAAESQRRVLHVLYCTIYKIITVAHTLYLFSSSTAA